MAQSPLFRLWGQIQKIEDNDDGTITVFGIASSGSRDGAGEIIAPEAMKAALPDYSKFPALREMHQPLAAGRVVEAAVDEDGITNIEALVVDPLAITKVRTGVYSAFSIGGKVLKRDPGDRTIITGLKLVEISLVDSPCNPDAVLSMWKADTMIEFKPEAADVIARAKILAKAAGTQRFKEFLFEAGQELISEHLIEKGELEPPESEPGAGAEAEIVDPPAGEETAKEAAAEGDDATQHNQIATDPTTETNDASAAEPAKEAAAESDPDEDDGAGEGAGDPDEAKEATASPDLVDALDAAIAKGTEIIESAAAEPPPEAPGPFADLGKAAAALKGISIEGESAQKSLWHVGRFAELLSSLACLQECVASEAQYEGDSSAIPAQLAAAVQNLGQILIGMAQEEVAELVGELSGAGVEIIYIGDEIDLANSIVDAVKADEALMAKAAERIGEPESASADQIAELEADKEKLSKALADAAPAVEKMVEGFQETIDALKGEVGDLRKRFMDEPMPAKTAGPAATRTIEKGDDSKGPEASNGIFGDLTGEQFDKAWNALSEEERGLILVKAALANPRQIAAR